MAPLHLVGKPLDWEDSKPLLKEIRRRGVKQFITLYRRVEHCTGAELLWGDELEYGVMKLEGSGAERTVKVSLRAPELLEQLVVCEGDDPRRHDGCAWHAEYGRWMVEATPRQPFGGYSTELLRVERSMRLRRQRLLSVLRPDEIIPTVPVFPLLGVGTFTDPPAEPGGPIANSSCVPDEAINPHPRMATLTKNIRTRRGSNVDIRLPLYKDLATPEFADGVAAEAAPGSAEWPQVRGDAMAFGMGSCCLQVTLQAHNVYESRHLTDQLAALAPIMLALTAGTPIFRGRLVDTDARWNTIAQSVDDRTPAERRAEGEPVDEAARQPELAGEGVRRLPKSRYSSISHYIYDCPAARMMGLDNPMQHMSDLGLEVEPEMAALLHDAGIDPPMARHIAYNFSRDPLVIFRERVDIDDEVETDHFENLQSTNWNSVRWKPPPAMNSEIGWRTEFRPMESQLTDFENAAFTVITVLLTRAILAFDLDLLLPISKVDENMQRAHARDAVRGQKFFFRKHLVEPHSGATPPRGSTPPAGAGHGGRRCNINHNTEYEEMTVAEILNGKGGYFPGLLPLVQAYIESIGCDATTRCARACHAPATRLPRAAAARRAHRWTGTHSGRGGRRAWERSPRAWRAMSTKPAPARPPPPTPPSPCAGTRCTGT